MVVYINNPIFACRSDLSPTAYVIGFFGLKLDRHSRVVFEIKYNLHSFLTKFKKHIIMKIAILEDDFNQLQMIEQALFGGDNDWTENIEHRMFKSGLDLLQALKIEYFDCLILDRKVDDMGGDVILQWVRQYADKQNRAYTTIIFLSNLRSEEDIVSILNAGADDYVTKPFRPRELVVRVQRLIRTNKTSKSMGASNSAQTNSTPSNSNNKNETIFETNGYVFNQFEQSVTRNGMIIELTEREFRLALLFFNNIGKPISRKSIFETIWKRANNSSSRALDTHIYRLRHTLDLTPKNGFILRTVYGFGYRLDMALRLHDSN